MDSGVTNDREILNRSVRDLEGRTLQMGRGSSVPINEVQSSYASFEKIPKTTKNSQDSTGLCKASQIKELLLGGGHPVCSSAPRPSPTKGG